MPNTTLGSVRPWHGSAPAGLCFRELSIQTQSAQWLPHAPTRPQPGPSRAPASQVRTERVSRLSVPPPHDPAVPHLHPPRLAPRGAWLPAASDITPYGGPGALLVHIEDLSVGASGRAGGGDNPLLAACTARSWRAASPRSPPAPAARQLAPRPNIWLSRRGPVRREGGARRGLEARRGGRGRRLVRGETLTRITSRQRAGRQRRHTRVSLAPYGTRRTVLGSGLGRASRRAVVWYRGQPGGGGYPNLAQQDPRAPTRPALLLGREEESPPRHPYPLHNVAPLVAGGGRVVCRAG